LELLPIWITLVEHAVLTLAAPQNNSVFSLINNNAYFQVFEIKNDAKMKRTMRRPLPSGRISPAHAAMWATSVGVAGTALLAWKVLAFSLHSICIYILPSFEIY
jgi:heme O synthase-like polyprenyltransferase